MPNDVYKYTHEALSALVSPRVASTVLDGALAAKGQDPNSVSTRTMRHLLAGAVRKELSGSLPRSGLTRRLKRLADELTLLPNTANHAETTPVLQALIAEADAERALVKLSSERLPAVPLGASPVSLGDAGTAARGSGDAVLPAATAAPNHLVALAGMPFAPASGHGRLPGRAPALRSPDRRSKPPHEAQATRKEITRLSELAVASALRLFGDIETVRQVVVVRGNEVLLHRGQGVDPDHLPNLVLSSRGLLARSGNLRAFSVERAAGVLFLFPFGEDCVVVVTFPHVNIGAVLNARAALEEAA